MKRYLSSLDALRGIAALAVAGSHFENLSGVSLHLQHAGVAVDFFFILSGFVIGQAYEDRLEDDLTIPAYMRLRLERLYPSILAGLGLGFAVALAAGERLHPAMALEILLLPALFGPQLHGGELFPLNGPQWSLLLELAANAGHAAARRWLTTPRLATLTALAGLALIPLTLRFGGLDVGWSRTNGWGGPPRVAFGFAAGLLIWRLHRLGFALPRLPFPLIAAGLILCLFRPLPEQGFYAWSDLAIVLLALPVLVALAVNSPTPPAFERTALWLGALSYPLYALHAPLLRAFEAVLDPMPETAEAIGWATAPIVVILLAAAFEHTVDRPVRAWLRARRSTAARVSA